MQESPLWKLKPAEAETLTGGPRCPAISADSPQRRLASEERLPPE